MCMIKIIILFMFNHLVIKMAPILFIMTIQKFSSLISLNATSNYEFVVNRSSSKAFNNIT